jgi:hypothetical protein
MPGEEEGELAVVIIILSGVEVVVVVVAGLIVCRVFRVAEHLPS